MENQTEKQAEKVIGMVEDELNQLRGNGSLTRFIASMLLAKIAMVNSQEEAGDAITQFAGFAIISKWFSKPTPKEIKEVFDATLDAVKNYMESEPMSQDRIEKADILLSLEYVNTIYDKYNK